MTATLLFLIIKYLKRKPFGAQVLNPGANPSIVS
jgi:hypothetical protein